MVHAQLSEAAKRGADRGAKRMSSGQLVGYPASCVLPIVVRGPRQWERDCPQPHIQRGVEGEEQPRVAAQGLDPGHWPCVMRLFDLCLYSPLAHPPRSPVWRVSSVRNAQRCSCLLARSPEKCRQAKQGPLARRRSAVRARAAPERLCERRCPQNCAQADRWKHVSREACARDQRHAHTHCVRRRRPWGCNDGD